MNDDAVRVLIVDDSRIFRGHMQAALADIPGVVIAGSVYSGVKAIEFLTATPVDLVTLDIEMPQMDGLATLREIRAINQSRPPDRRAETVLVSAKTTRGARCTVDGLQLGALDFILKPDGDDPAANAQQLRTLLSEKIAMVRQRRSRRGGVAAAPSPPRPYRPDRFGPSAATPARAALAIGVSTGGPEALAKLLPRLIARTDRPIFIVQHNLQGLSGFLAASLSRATGADVIEADQGMIVRRGKIYLAKGGRHMIVRGPSEESPDVTIGLSDSPPENHSKPSVDVFLRSAASVYGTGLVTAILTGMLNDGAQGVRVVKRAGGHVVAQDEASSVVWGMPRAAIETGAVDAVVPLDQMADVLAKLLGRGAEPGTQRPIPETPR